jgi:hypothetical protein
MDSVKSEAEFVRLFAGGKWIRTVGTRKISYGFGAPL